MDASALIRDDGRWLFEFVAYDPDQRLFLPRADEPARRDDLWRSTCFELFYLKDDGAYCEFNFSPSQSWAAYAFAAYRVGRTDLPMRNEPGIAAVRTKSTYAQLALLDPHDVEAALEARLALSAVIEETDGTKSFWALAHAPGPPDFHNPACFTATLPAPAF